jgi:hypothetical protein
MRAGPPQPNHLVAGETRSSEDAASPRRRRSRSARIRSADVAMVVSLRG